MASCTAFLPYYVLSRMFDMSLRSYVNSSLNSVNLWCKSFPKERGFCLKSLICCENKRIRSLELMDIYQITDDLGDYIK